MNPFWRQCQKGRKNDYFGLIFELMIEINLNQKKDAFFKFTDAIKLKLSNTK